MYNMFEASCDYLWHICVCWRDTYYWSRAGVLFMGGLCSWVVCVHMSTVQLKRERQITLVILETLTPTSKEPTIQWNEPTTELLADRLTSKPRNLTNIQPTNHSATDWPTNKPTDPPTTDQQQNYQMTNQCTDTPNDPQTNPHQTNYRAAKWPTEQHI